MRFSSATLAALSEYPASERKLGETVAEQRERQAAVRRSVLAALGGALVASGRYAAGLDTLARAAEAGWDVDVLRDVYAARLAAGDTASALSAAARVAVDPRTSSAAADSIRQLAERRLSSAEWQDQLRAARAEFVQRMLASATTRSLPDTIRVRGLDGRTHDLRALVNGRVTAVVFWSRSCGPAVQALPRVNAVAERLAQSGVQVIGIVEEASPSRELQAFLRETGVTFSTYLDSSHEASHAFKQWGTPYYYVLDADGRIRFDVTTSVDEMLARAEALRLSDPVRRE